MSLDCKLIKSTAKQRVKEAIPNPRTITLVYYLLSVGLPVLNSAFLAVSFNVSGLGSTIGMFLSVVIGLVVFILSFGYMKYALALWRQEETGLSMLFSAVSHFVPVLLLSLMIGVLSFAWLIGISLVLTLVGAILATIVGDWILYVLMIPCFLLYFNKMLNYTLAFFVILDQPEIGVMNAIRTSKTMMKGRKMALIRLMLSFIGWSVLIVLLSALVGAVVGAALGTSMDVDTLSFLSTILAYLVTAPLTLWLMPYFYCTLAGFYDHLNLNTVETIHVPTNTQTQEQNYFSEKDQPYQGPDLPER